MESYFSEFLSKSELHPQKSAIEDLGISFGQLAKKSIQFINGLRKVVNKGDYMLVCCNESLSYIISAFACDHLELVFIPFSYDSPKNKKDSFIKEINPKQIVDSLYISSTIKNESDQLIEKENTAEDSVLAIFQTSGTSGKSKGACFTRSAVNSNIKNNIFNLKIDENEKMWSYGGHHLPAFVFTFSVSTLISGGTILLSSLDPIKSPEFINKYKPSFTYLPPATILMLNRFPIIWDKIDFSSFRTALVAGDSSTDDVPRLLFQKNIQSVYQTYGSTDACMATPLLAHWVKTSTTPHIMSFDVEPTQGWEYKLAPDGELLTRGPGQMYMYFGQPELTQTAYEGGWFHTGDILEYRITEDSGKRLFFVCRKKDIIKVMNNVVSPIEVEQVIMQLEEVVECAILGIPDTYTGEKIIACVVPKKDSDLNQLKKKIKLYCKELLDNFAVPKTIDFYPELPKTNTGHTLKTQKSALKAFYIS